MLNGKFCPKGQGELSLTGLTEVL